ncbi:PAS domain-containing response regulator [Halolamina salifodinae]|uniref:PAS domain S-box-containing protein n=1 Tax=Halolamina salifodinae TaxID=1202767 RepID=A0A8T4GWC3_9EURY|nr:PAS domain S-box protein [Halolamina salifodinae]MBP1987206.1 PAS domain S-box-containing protein [Halolamina salifodinae]
MEHTGDAIRVLHVDDDPAFADLTVRFLERENERFEVTTARSASAGLERLVAERFDCVVSDHDMPRTTGIEFLETVRAEQPGLPFILFTGKGSEEVASEAISRGVTDYLQKARGTEHYAILANRIGNAVGSYRAERMVERTRSQFEAIAEHTLDAIVTIDADSRVRFANPAVEDLFGYAPDELEGEPLLAIMSERYHASHLSAIDRYVDTDERTIGWSNVEFPAKHRDGTEVPVSISFGEFEHDGEKRFIGIMREVSGTPQYGGQDPAFLEALVETIGVGVAAYDESGTLSYVNERFAENLGTDKEHLEGTAIWEINPVLDREQFDAYWASFEPGETRTAETTHSFEGTELPVEAVTTCADIAGPTYHFGTVRDISEDLG